MQNTEKYTAHIFGKPLMREQNTFYFETISHLPNILLNGVGVESSQRAYGYHAISKENIH